MKDSFIGLRVTVAGTGQPFQVDAVGAQTAQAIRAVHRLNHDLLIIHLQFRLAVDKTMNPDEAIITDAREIDDKGGRKIENQPS